jgi:hypothetical protein
MTKLKGYQINLLKRFQEKGVLMKKNYTVDAWCECKIIDLNLVIDVQPNDSEQVIQERLRDAFLESLDSEIKLESFIDDFSVEPYEDLK